MILFDIIVCDAKGCAYIFPLIKHFKSFTVVSYIHFIFMIFLDCMIFLYVIFEVIFLSIPFLLD